MFARKLLRDSTDNYCDDGTGINWYSISFGAASANGLLQKPDSSILVGAGATFRVSTDNGATWALFSSLGATTPYGVCFLENGDILVSTFGSSILRSTDGGLTLSSLASFGTGLAMITQLRSGTILVCSYFSGSVFRSNDNGSNWAASALPGNVHGICELNDGRVAVVGNDKISFSADQGTTWSAFVTITGSNNLLSIRQLKGGDILAVDFGAGKVFRSTDNGVTFDSGTPTSYGIFDVIQLKNGDVLVSKTIPSSIANIYKSNKACLS